MVIDEGVRVAVAANVHTRKFDEDLVILDLTRGEYFAVDHVGVQVWEGLARGRSLAEIADDLAPRYDVDRATLLSDFVAFIEELLVRGLVVECPVP